MMCLRCAKSLHCTSDSTSPQLCGECLEQSEAGNRGARKVSKLKDRVAKSLGWLDYEHFLINEDNMSPGFFSAVKRLIEKEQENADLKAENERLIKALTKIIVEDDSLEECWDTAIRAKAEYRKSKT